MIERLQQIVNEDYQARQHIKKNILNDIRAAGQVATTTIAKAAAEMEAYRQANPDKVKEIKDIPNEEIVLEMLALTLTLVRPATIQEIAHGLAVFLDTEDFIAGVELATDLLCCAEKAVLLFIHPPGTHSGSPTITPRFTAGDETFLAIEKTRFLDPMVCTPKPWTTNTNGGYITVRKSAILGRHTHHDDPLALDVLNLLQEIEWELDDEVLAEPEDPPSKIETREQLAAHNLHCKVANEVYKGFKNQPFWKVYGFDSRGRIYEHGYYINHQSYSYKKACSNFHKREKINGFT